MGQFPGLCILGKSPGIDSAHQHLRISELPSGFKGEDNPGFSTGASSCAWYVGYDPL